MASRRVRIKGITNIPQRRKPENCTNGNETEQKENDSNKSQEIIDKPNLNSTLNSHANACDKGNKDILNIDSHVETADTNAQVSEDLKKNELSCVDKEIELLNTRPTLHIKHNDELKEKKDTENQAIAGSTDANKTAVEKVIQTDKVPHVRRKFLKPSVCVNVINRKPKEKIEEVKAEPNKENVQEHANINLNEIEISANNVNSSILIQKIEPEAGPLIPKLESGSDTEHQQPPPSPTKILNRRIKAIPKLHQRRTSFSIGSASESEDDTRRSYSRIRNDSVCSVASGINECHSANETISPIRKEFTMVQRKCRKTEQTRKFAEARREFNMKCNNGKPDKQKLTMIDLIFYNPATNPMSCNKQKRKITTSSEISDTKSNKGDGLDEEKADDPQSSESDNEVPAPQIKVGPNGEIVVDEKSLVIENAETKRGREALQMSEVVNGDEDTSYGIYKRIKRSKDWSKDETLRFYRALNTIGTDFTMMCELFPNRTRRELKMKFKKEERLNQSLIDRAVMQPIEFDMTELRKDLELEERKAEENKRRAQETKSMKATITEQKKHMKKGERIKGIDKNPEHFTTSEVKKVEPVKKKKKTAYETIKRGINGILSDSDDDEDLHESNLPMDNTREDSDESSENEDKAEDVSNILKPTRYGRVPKARSQDIIDSSIKEIRKKRKIVSDFSNDDKNKGSLEPGSIMIVKSKTPADEVVFKVYIVTDNNTKQQIDLEPNVLQNLTGMEANKLKRKICDIQAHNILTISARECPTGAEQDIENISGSNNFKKLPDNKSKSSISSSEIDISGDSIIFPFDECLTPTVGNQNITVSHEDNKMIVITENNKQCVLTT